MYGASTFFSFGANIDFSAPIRSMSMHRSIEVLKNGGKFLSGCVGQRTCICLLKSTHRDFRGPNNFLWVCVDFPTEPQDRFFDADSIDVDASIDRGAQKRSKIPYRLRRICLKKSTDAATVTVHTLRWNAQQRLTPMQMRERTRRARAIALTHPTHRWAAKHLLTPGLQFSP